MALAAVCFLAPASPLRAQDDLARTSEEAKQAMDAGRFAEAAALYRELVRSLPDNAGLRLDLGLALHSDGKYQDALVQFQQAIRRQPDLEPARLMLGLTYLELNRPRDAVEPLSLVLQADPGNGRARLKLSEAYLASGENEKARDGFMTVTESDPSSAKAWQGLGLSYSALSRVTFSKLEKLDPSSDYRDALLARSLVARGQDRTAFFWYRQALLKNDRLRGAHAALAGIYRRSGHQDWAATEESRELELGRPECGRESLECDFVAGRFPQLFALAAREPGAESLYWQAQGYEELSAQAFSRLAAMPSSPEVHELMAQADVTQGDYRAAADEWNEALRLAPGETSLKQGLAYALWLEGSYREAEPLLAELVELDPESAEIHFELGDSLLGMGSADKAIPPLEEAVRLDPDLAPARTALGRAYLHAGKPKQAVVQLKAAAGADSKALYELAEAYKQTGQKTLADEALRKFQRSSSAALARSQQLDREHEIVAP
jgi:tetratricopeptide (TPR) repeat protein